MLYEAILVSVLRIYCCIQFTGASSKRLATHTCITRASSCARIEHNVLTWVGGSFRRGSDSFWVFSPETNIISLRHILPCLYISPCCSESSCRIYLLQTTLQQLYQVILLFFIGIRFKGCPCYTARERTVTQTRPRQGK